MKDGFTHCLVGQLKRLVCMTMGSKVSDKLIAAWSFFFLNALVEVSQRYLYFSLSLISGV